jgi:S1-C subfamily serine protease
MVKEYLSQRRIGFQERDVSRNPAYAQELVNNTGQMGVPVTVIDRQVVIGFDRTKLEQVLAQTGETQHPPFGASIADASKITAKQGGGVTFGAYIGRVRPGSVAERLGLAPGDIIIELNNKNIAGASELEQALSRLARGDQISIVFIRENTKKATRGIY